MTLFDANARSKYKITKVKGDEDIIRRLLNIGFAPGCNIEILALSPFGKTVLVKIRGIKVALRQNATDCIFVERI